MKKEIQQKETDGKGMFYYEEEGDIIAELIYTVQDNGIITLDHTEVHPEKKGGNLAKNLVRHSVYYARERQLKIDPLCEYASKQFERNEEYHDVKVE